MTIKESKIQLYRAFVLSKNKDITELEGEIFYRLTNDPDIEEYQKQLNSRGKICER